MVELHQKLGAALVRLGNATEGKRHLKLAIKKYEERAAMGELEAATEYYVAAAYSLLDDAEHAVKHLEAAVSKQARNRRRASNDPDFEEIRPALTALGLIEEVPA